MKAWPLLLRSAVLVLGSTAVLSQNPLPGPPASGVGGGAGTKPIIPPGTGTSLTGTPMRGDESRRYNPFETYSPMTPEMGRRQRLVEYFAAQFQKKNLADTEKLLTLARELNSESEQTGAGLPTVGEMKKAEEIEKLAKRVRQRLTIP